MNNFEEISDEELARFIEGTGTDEENNRILNSINSEEELKAMALAFASQKMMEDEGGLEDLPELDLNKGNVVPFIPFEKLRACGFLGNDSDDADAESDE